jgi:glycosyltransferase involved in cell wall biosynthesis
MKIKKNEIKKSRVALLIDTWFPAYSGEQIHVAKLAAALSEKGYLVDILTCGADEGLKKEEKDLERMNGVTVKRLSKWRGVYTVWLLGYLLAFGRQYNLMHAHTTLSAIAMNMASWFTRVPTVVTVHASRVFETSWTLRKLLDRVVFLETKYSQEITVSEHFLKARNVNDHVLLIPNGMDTEPFDLVKIEKSPERFETLFVGRLVHEKGVDVLLRATKKLIESNEFIKSRKDFTLHLVGEGYERSDLEKMAEKLGISKYLRFHGKVTGEALVELYKGADLFVLPSRFEGLPLTLLEACAAKLPILATNVGDNRKLVLENVNGHLVQPDDEEELAYYLEYFALNPGLEQMGEASYDLVQQEYNWESSMQKILRVYDSLKQEKVSDDLMPWQYLAMLLQNRKLKPYRGRAPLKFCFTVNIEQAYSASALPHEVEHVAPFIEHFSELSSSLEIPSTLYVQDDLFEPYLEELKAMQKSGHELAVLGEKKNLRGVKEGFKDLKLKGLRLFRPVEGFADGELKYVHELGFEYLPTSEDPLPRIGWRFVVPFGRRVVMNLKNVIKMSDEEFLDAVNRLRSYQRDNGVSPYLIFECSSWEFQSRDYAAWASGENFTELSKKIAFLKEHMEIEFMGLSDFCKSCSLSA